MAGMLSLLMFVSYTLADKKTSLSATKPNAQVVKPVVLREQYNFAGENVPIQNFDVRERLDRELLVNTYWHSNTVLCLKSMQRFFPIIENILKEYRIPVDFKYIPVIETSLRNETSPAGAKGIWQFMKPVAESYKLEINDEVDERYHLIKATNAACQHILRYKQRFGSWTLAAAAYNMGETGVARELETQGEKNYYDININDESSRYIFRLLALKEIGEHPDDYGFYIDPVDKYNTIRTHSVEVSSSIPNLGAWAHDHGTTYRMLKVLNPWLRSSSLTVNPKVKKSYYIDLPD